MDIILDILQIVLQHHPDSEFVNSIHRFYCEKGGLSKKQLQGLYGKAVKIAEIPPGKLATLQAIINKKATKFRSEKPLTVTATVKDEETGRQLETILAVYPQHKQALFLKSKFEKNEIITTEEKLQLSRFVKAVKNKTAS